MSILITGGTGFLGVNLAKRLVDQGHRVVLFELAPNLKVLGDYVSRVELVRGDVANWPEVLDVVKQYGVKTIFHTAALLSANAEKNPLRAYQVNANGTWHVLEAARLFDVETVVFTSTNGTYGDHIGKRVSNDAPQFPRIIYGSTKVAGERLGEFYHYRYGLNFRGLRFPSVVGPGRGAGGVSTYTTLAIQNAALGLPYELYVSPETETPLLYVEDGVSALVELAEAPEEQLTRRMYSMSGVFCSAGELVNEILNIVPDARITFNINPEIDEVMKKIPFMEDTLAARDWGWRQRYNDLPALVTSFVAEVQKKREIYL